MACYQDFRFHLETLKMLGLLTFSHNKKRDSLEVTPKDELYSKVILICWQILLISMLTYCFSFPEHFRLEIYNDTGNVYICCEFGFCCLLLSFIATYCYARREQHLQTVLKLLQLNKDRQLPRRCKKILQQYYGLYIFLFLFSFWNYLDAFWRNNVSISAFICYFLLYTLNFSVCGLLIIWYICIKRMLKHHFFCCNENLKRLLRSCRKANFQLDIHNQLRLRYNLLFICRDSINSSYGLIMLTISVYMVFSSPSGIFFLISVVFDKRWDENTFDGIIWTIHSITWNAPMIISFTLMLGPHSIEQETLKYFGLFCFSYDVKCDVLRMSRKDIFYARAVLYALQATLVVMFVYCVTNPTNFYLNIYNYTGNIYICIEFCFICSNLSFINAYFFINRKRNFLAVQQMMNFNRNERLPRKCRKILNRLYIMYLLLVILSFQNYIKGFYYSFLPISVCICYCFLFTLNFVICGMIMLWYICIERIIKHHFDCVNKKLERLLNSLGKESIHLKFHGLLREHYDLLEIFRDHINSSYGFIMLVITSYMVFSAPNGAFFLVSVVFEKKMQGFMNNIHGAVTASLWNAHWLTMFISMICGNQIDEEANKTAKILSTVPRTGTGVEKLVQKFLLKNLRRKPILTAYGFFSLDKSTLFKLFTAIFTYMVILVQFKEMENSRKELGYTPAAVTH